MKKFVVLIALLVFPVGVLFAHPASEIKADYMTGTKTLSIDVMHMVSTSKNMDTMKHYIKEITVMLNGVKVETKTFTSQTGDSTKVSIKVNAKAGDKISINTTCSIAGTKSVEITVK